MKNILIDMTMDEHKLALLKNIPGVNVTVVPCSEEAHTLDKSMVQNQHMYFCSLPASNMEDFTSLEFMQIASVGYSHLYPLQLYGKPLRISNASGVFDIPIAEWNVVMAINLARDMRKVINNQERQIWDRAARYQTEIRGSVIGIWGYGGIGRETARLFKALGMKVHVMVRESVRTRSNIYLVPGTGDPEGKLPDRIFTAGEEREFLSGLDYLILTMPITRYTHGIIGEDELKSLPPHAFVLNPARGHLIQEEALVRALREGWIAGAALDTHYHYPMPAEHPLWRLPNVIMTPHISGSSQSTFFRERVWDIFVQNVTRLLNREPLLNELTQAQLKDEY